MCEGEDIEGQREKREKKREKEGGQKLDEGCETRRDGSEYSGSHVRVREVGVGGSYIYKKTGECALVAHVQEYTRGMHTRDCYGGLLETKVTVSYILRTLVTICPHSLHPVVYFRP